MADENAFNEEIQAPAPDPNESPNFPEATTIPEIQPETQVGEQVVSPRCSRILANRTQCHRLATRREGADVEGRYAVCDVCWMLEGSPEAYDTEITRKGA